MKWLFALFSSSIGKKQLMALTGLCLIFFLIVHLVGNFTLFMGEEPFNEYAKFYSDHPKLLLVAEAGLVTLFLVHIFLAIRVTLQNRSARPQAYVAKDASDATLASRTMIFTGFVILSFLIWHLIMFKFSEPENLYEAVSSVFRLPLVAGASAIAMFLLGFHLNHAIKSLLQTFGFDHPNYTPLTKCLGFIISLFIGIGFALIPLYFILMKG